MCEHSNRFTKIAVYAIVTIMIALLLTIGVRAFTRVILIDKYSMDNAFTRIVMFDNEELKKIDQKGQQDIDWLALYPFETKQAIEAESMGKTQKSGVAGAIDDFKNSLSTFTKENLVLYTNFTECAKAYNNSIGWTIEKYDEPTILIYDDGYYIETMWKLDVQSQAENICEFNSFLNKMDIPFVYTVLPGKVSKLDTEASGVIDFSNQNMDALLNKLRNADVELFDLRENMVEVFSDYHNQFFVTDHHWTPDTGLWAAGEVAKYLNENHGYNFDIEKYESQNFRRDVYENIFLGTYGRKLTLSVVEPENFELLYPNYETNLTIEIPSKKLNDTGDFSVYYYYKMLNPGDYYNSSPYVAYIYGDDVITKLTNNNCDNEKSILVIGDSMDNLMLPFLSLGVKHISAMDLRLFNGSLRTFIERHKDEYDLILLTNSVCSLTDSELFDFS